MKEYPNLISAEIVADSLNQFQERITTYKLVFPRYILAELNTHRLFSKNSASSRAIPFEKMVKSVMDNPFIPMAWQTHHKGMQGTEYLTAPIDIAFAHDLWLEARDKAVKSAKNLYNLGGGTGKGVTKQLCNRLLEPFLYHTVLLTATEYDNFFELRSPKYQWENYDEPYGYTDKKSKKDYNKELNAYDTTAPKTQLEWLKINKGAADIHIMDLAEKMYDAYNESEPEQLKEGEWHIPFAEDKTDLNKLADLYKPTGSYDPNNPPPDSYYQEELTKIAVKIATARCARISYETLGDNPVIDYEKDIKLHDDLLAMGHMSPFEHCAKVMNQDERNEHIKTEDANFFYMDQDKEDKQRGEILVNGFIKEDAFGWSRNFKGFQQYREIIENEQARP